MTVRKLTSADVEQAKLVRALGWETVVNNEHIGREDAIANSCKPMKNVSDFRVWGAFTGDGTLSTTLDEMRHELRLDGGWYRSCAIGGVVTRPDMRRMGAVRESLDVLFEYMHEEGIPFSTLLPFDVPFYRMFGYEGIYRICNISMPVRSLSRYRCDIRRISELGGENSLPELNAFYEKHTGDMNMALRRDKLLWSRVVNFDPGADRRYTYVCHGEGGALSGYMSFRPELIDGVKTMKVTELLYDGRDSLCELLGFIYTFVAHYDRVLFFELPLSLDFYLMLDDYNTTVYEQRICNMLRVGDAETALAAKRYPVREGRFSIKVEDKLDWNRGIYDVEFGGGESRVTKRVSGDYDIAVDERALARLVFGEEALFADAMRLVPNIEVSGNRETLNEVFVRRPLFHTDFY